jgi:hypothetical protein
VKTLLRALLAGLLLLLLAGWLSPSLGTQLLPAASAWMGKVEPAFSVLRLERQSRPEGDRVRMQVALTQPVITGERVVMPHPRGHAWAQVPAAQIWQGPVLLLWVLLAWPLARGGAELLARLALAVPVLAAWMLLDTPLVLLAEVWKLLLQADPQPALKALVLWSDLLRGGGRFGLPLLAGAAVVLAVRAVVANGPGTRSPNASHDEGWPLPAQRH